MDERNNNYHMDPWDSDSYETGSTRPPKSHGGLIAVLLVLVIFLGGISSALGVLNIKLFHKLDAGGNDPDSVVFHPNSSETTTAPTESTVVKTDPSVPVATGSASLQLNQTPEAVDNVPQEGGMSLQDIYLKAIDSVVSITCTTGEGTASGTGVVLSENGYIVTNCHVVDGADSIQVLFTDERTMTAALVGADAVSDLAVLYVSAGDLTPAEFGDSSTLRVGDAVVAIGDPLGVELRGTMTDGIVSAINRDLATGGRTMTLIQTNAALNSGNSGGPLLNCYGQVIGINTMKISAFTDDAGVEGLGFAIPSTTVKDIVDQIISQGYVSGRPALGITGEDVSAYYQKFYRLPAGVYVTEIASGSAAEAAGLAAGDIILTMDGQRLSGTDDLNTAMYSHDVGDTVVLTIYRLSDRKQYSVTITLGESDS